MSDKVLLLIKGLGRGGAEQLLASAARFLDHDRFGYEVAYLLPWKDALVDELRTAGLPVHCLDGHRGVAWASRLRRLVRDRDIDLLHVHSPYAAIGAHLAFPGRGGPLVVYTEHNVWDHRHPATYWANLLTFPRNDHVFAVSEAVSRSIGYPELLGFLPMPPVETLYHGLDPTAIAAWRPDGVRAELGLHDATPVVGTVANFRQQKRYDVLLDAASSVCGSVPDVRFVFVGTGPLEDTMRRRAGELGLDGRILFTGRRDDAPRVAAAFDVFVLASSYEGLSIALLEAMALGRACVVTDVRGVSEIVTDGRDARVVPADDPAAMASAIRRLLGDAQLRERLGRRARERAADFHLPSAVRRHEEVYATLLERKRRAAGPVAAGAGTSRRAFGGGRRRGGDQRSVGAR